MMMTPKELEEVRRLTRERLKNGPVYVTLGLADVQTVDTDTNATRPSNVAVEQTKKWSETCQL